ncbi:MAG: hypothetical protein MJ200_04770 [Mycoplasmoidaceae bacterium]|nr:hypothetical protein [Mycoplasmoidaceae bacterium]
MGKKVKYTIVDKNTIALAENANKGDIIDLNEKAELDTSSVVQNFDRELRGLAKEQAKDLSQAEVNKAVADKEKTISKLENEIALLKKDLQANNSQVQDKIDNAVLKAEKAKDDQIHSLKDQIKTLENQ